MAIEVHIASKIEWTEQGWAQYGDMKRNVELVHSYYGPKAGNHVATSLFICMDRLFTCGPCNVQKDGNSLFVVTPHIVFGVNWHPVNASMFEMLTTYPLAETDPAWPSIGTWSLNS